MQWEGWSISHWLSIQEAYIQSLCNPCEICVDSVAIKQISFLVVQLSSANLTNKAAYLLSSPFGAGVLDLHLRPQQQGTQIHLTTVINHETCPYTDTK